MMHSYGEFLTRFDKAHATTTHRHSPRNTRCAVILETRPLPHLPKVVRNVMFFLGPQWNLQILGSRASLGLLEDSLPGWELPSAEVASVAAMPDLQTASRFSVETMYTSHPAGVHGTNRRFHSVEVAERIVGDTRC
jgi:hypothetical protein